MLERLGHALYWAGCAVTAVLIIVGLIAASSGGQGSGAVLAVFVAGAVLAWLAGRACRYVLAGR